MLTGLLNDDSCDFSCFPPSIDPAWRAHEHPSNNNRSNSGINDSKTLKLKGKGKKENDRLSAIAGRSIRKRVQLVALLRIITPIILSRQRSKEKSNSSSIISVVDFCAGCGHLGLLIAAVFPSVSVTLVDVKPIALQIAAKRAEAGGLTNVQTVQSTVLALPESIECDVAVALHACGDASDDVLQMAVKRRAALIVAPCCVGSLATPGLSSHLGKSGKQHQQGNISDEESKSPSDDTITPKGKMLSEMVTLNEFALLARAADFGELATGNDQWRGIAKMILEQDRVAGLCERGYTDALPVKMKPETCTPKNDVLVAWPPETSMNGEDSSSNNDLWCVDHRSNGAIVDFQNSSVLNGLGIKEVEAVERMLRTVVCEAGSSGIYISPPGGGKRARKIIHAVADGLGLTHESIGRGSERHVIVKRHEHWPLFLDRYVGVSGPQIDTLAKSFFRFVPDQSVQRKRSLRGETHHVTIISPRELPDVMDKYNNDEQTLLQICHDSLSSSTFRAHGVGSATKFIMNETTGNGATLDETTAYFVVVEWEQAQVLRRQLGLDPCDFHITLGFSDRDVYEVPKNNSSLIHCAELECSPWTL